jgi:hypothetical protein
VRKQSHERKINNLKRKMAQISNVRNKGNREALLAEANALLADVTENSAKKGEKNKKVHIEDAEPGVAEPTIHNASSSAPLPKA